MPDLRDRLQELADAATRDAVTPGPAHAIRRGRRRRRHLAAGVASLLAVVLAAGAVGTGRLHGRTTTEPLVPTVTSPPPAPGLTPGRTRVSLPEQTLHRLAAELRRCPGGTSIPPDMIGYTWSARYRQLLMVAAKQPPAGTRFCWSVGWAGEQGQWGVTGARRVGASSTLLTFTGNIEPGFAQIAGTVTKRAARVRLRFRDGRPPIDLKILHAGDRYPVNFYVGFFAQGPTSAQQGGWAASTLTALEATGREIVTCRVGPPGDGTPKCPGN
jgi:hypothetical protein